ncbi:signal-induced proliferation-associated 1-like protein 3 [Passer domesticus]|uniref:signal-induced proliferation-associated 1-like protein 3 n=1 Tax=Passer domesticus TaxID=48849 RepID=UPI0030FE47B1
MATAPPAGRKAGSDRAAPSAAPKIPGRGREGNGELGRQVNVFGQPRLRASLRDLRSPRRVPKSSIEDDLKRLILMDNSCPEPEPAPPLHRTLSDESLCGGRRRSPHNSQNSQNSQNSPNSQNSQNAQSAPNCPNLVNFGDFGSRAEALPGSSRNTLPARRGPAARLEPGADAAARRRPRSSGRRSSAPPRPTKCSAPCRCSR